jgi:formylmethanofuran--tetrahydromethanopterin N-formyltransferase
MPGRWPCIWGIAALLTINDIPIEDTFAEAFPMTAARLIVTAETPGWAQTAGQVTTGYAASVIGCDAEAGIERVLPRDATPCRRRPSTASASAS